MIGATYLVPSVSQDVPVTGRGVSVVAVPQMIHDFLNVLPGAVVVGGPVPSWLASASQEMAAYNGQRLHHAEWRITDDPDDLREWVPADMVADCLAALEVHASVAVGEMYWA